MKKIFWRGEFVGGMLVGAMALSLLAGCGKKDDPISQAEKTEKDRPGIAEIKAIAEEGFIYGLPIVMNYAVMYTLHRGPRLRPVQGAVRQDQERSPRLYLPGHGDRHTQQRYTLLVPLDGSARRTDRALGPGGGEIALLRGAA